MILLDRRPSSGNFGGKLKSVPNIICYVYDPSGPLISVVITTLNDGDTVEACVRSIFNQSYHNFELILVDAKSPDGTYAKAMDLEELSKHFKNCKRYLPISADANSPAKGRNLGVKMASGSVIAFTDGDCIAQPNWLANLVRHLSRKSGIVGGPNIIRHRRESKMLDAIDRVLATPLGSGGSPQFCRINQIREVQYVPACNMAIDKRLFDDIGGFDENLRYNEDTDLCSRIRKKGYSITYVPQSIVDHFMGVESLLAFSKFIYKYGSEKGKNLSTNRKHLSKFNVLSLIFILTYVLLILILTLGNADEMVLLILMLLTSVAVVTIIVMSLGIAVEYSDPWMSILAFVVFISIFMIYNIGFVLGYICGILVIPILKHWS